VHLKTGSKGSDLVKELLGSGDNGWCADVWQAKVHKDSQEEELSGDQVRLDKGGLERSDSKSIIPSSYITNNL